MRSLFTAILTTTWVIWPWILTHPAVAATSCDALAPQRPVETAIRAELGGNTGGLLLKALGSFEFEGQFEQVRNDILKEFPNSDRLHMFNSLVYVLCEMLMSSDLDDVTKFSKFESLSSKWMNEEPSLILTQLESNDIMAQKTAIEEGLVHPDIFVQQTTIDVALKSSNRALRARALQAAILGQKALGIYFCNDHEDAKQGVCSGILNFVIENISHQGASITFTGYFKGDAVYGSVRNDLATGTLTGDTISAAANRCAFSATLQQDQLMIGNIHCPLYLDGELYRGRSFPVVLRLF